MNKIENMLCDALGSDVAEGLDAAAMCSLIISQRDNARNEAERYKQLLFLVDRELTTLKYGY